MYNFFIVSVFYHTSQKRLSETSSRVSQESRELASVSEAATSHLGLGQNFERFGLVSAQKVSCKSLPASAICLSGTFSAVISLHLLLTVSDDCHGSWQ